VASAPRTGRTNNDGRKRKNYLLRRQLTPHSNKGKGANLVPGTVKLLHLKNEKKTHKDQEVACLA
jgi:hypothetical protein